MARTIDRIKALEALLSAPAALARMFSVPVSLRLLDDWQGEVERARAACGQSLAPDAVPLLDGDEQAWSEYASHHQARLIASAIDDVERTNANAAAKAQAEHAAKQPPKPKRKTEPAPTFFPQPNPFALART